MNVRMPCAVGEGDETTAAYDDACAAGPLGLIGVTTGTVSVAATGNQSRSHQGRARLNQTHPRPA